MSKHETTIAYDRVKKQWPGLIIKNYMPRHRGYPDFTLVNGVVVFAEVKWLSRSNEYPAVELLQMDWLNRLELAGAYAFVLAAHDGHELHVGPKRCPGWIAWRAPITRDLTTSRDEVDYTRLPIPWWIGEQLADFSVKLLWDRHEQ